MRETSDSDADMNSLGTIQVICLIGVLGSILGIVYEARSQDAWLMPILLIIGPVFVATVTWLSGIYRLSPEGEKASERLTAVVIAAFLADLTLGRGIAGDHAGLVTVTGIYVLGLWLLPVCHFALRRRRKSSSPTQLG
jgi:hypothetical protein